MSFLCKSKFYNLTLTIDYVHIFNVIIFNCERDNVRILDGKDQQKAVAPAGPPRTNKNQMAFEGVSVGIEKIITTQKDLSSLLHLRDHQLVQQKEARTETTRDYQNKLLERIFRRDHEQKQYGINCTRGTTN